MQLQQVAGEVSSQRAKDATAGAKGEAPALGGYGRSIGIGRTTGDSGTSCTLDGGTARDVPSIAKGHKRPKLNAQTRTSRPEATEVRYSMANLRHEQVASSATDRAADSVSAAAVLSVGSVATKPSASSIATATPTVTVPGTINAHMAGVATAVAAISASIGATHSPVQRPVGKVKMSELLTSLAERLAENGQSGKADVIVSTNTKYRNGEITYAAAMGRLMEVVGREQLLHEIARLSTAGGRMATPAGN